MERKLNFGESNDSLDPPRHQYHSKFTGSEDDYDSHQTHRRSSSHDHKAATYIADEKTTSSAAARYSSKKETPSSSSAAAKHTASSFAEEKQKLIEIQQDIEADEEFEALKMAPKVVNPIIGQSLFAKRFVSGFRM